MGILGPVVRDDALALSHGILACQNFGDISRETLGDLTSYLNAETSVLFEFTRDGERFRLGRHARHQIPASSLKDYGTHYIQMDPVVLKSWALDPCRGKAGRFELVCLSEIFDEHKLLESPYYNEFLRPQHIHHVLALFFRPSVTESPVMGFGFHRPRAATKFSSLEIERARQIAPALFASINSIALTERLRAHEEVVSALTRATADMGVMILDSRRMLRYLNERAHAALAIEDAEETPTRRNSALFALVAELCDQLERTNGLDCAPRQRSFESANDAAGGKTVTVQKFINDDGERRFIVTICPSRFELALEQQAKTLGMTRRETDIIRFVASGATNPQIADQLCLSIRTVENHLRSVFAKAGVHSRTQLIRQLLGDS